MESSTYVSSEVRFPFNESENLYSGKLTWNPAVFGYTIGGTVGLYAAALDPRITSVVSISGFTPMRTDTADRGTGGLARYSEERALLPRLGFFIGNESRLPYDFDELVAAIAPRSVLVVEPTMDRATTASCG